MTFASKSMYVNDLCETLPTDTDQGIAILFQTSFRVPQMDDAHVKDKSGFRTADSIFSQGYSKRLAISAPSTTLHKQF